MIEVYTDAATAGNPGPSAVGIYIKDRHKFSKYLGSCSNHEAEFLAVIYALEYCSQHYSGEIISIRSDSQVVVHSADTEHCKNPAYAPLLGKILALHQHFSYVFYKWIPDKENKHADRLAREELKKNQ
ncbi:ribonuclease H [Halobacillus andaensis]|uniref:Ribonuclease H n=1 Tax=Halobacillus andaensis TaxID=1176239 RepID=A0A917B0G8_HALAA|nr:ribonuclease HI family protein [Halobacillus andaensis]MBP2003319.1 ribonuclease HI [Halobacillus andaensis]GGF09763.1 ribonuclease H [Halobacillus andaensis]